MRPALRPTRQRNADVTVEHAQLRIVARDHDGPARIPFAAAADGALRFQGRSEEHTSELQSHSDLVCRLLLEKKKNINRINVTTNDACGFPLRVSNHWTVNTNVAIVVISQSKTVSTHLNTIQSVMRTLYDRAR